MDGGDKGLDIFTTVAAVATVTASDVTTFGDVAGAPSTDKGAIHPSRCIEMSILRVSLCFKIVIILPLKIVMLNCQQNMIKE